MCVTGKQVLEPSSAASRGIHQQEAPQEEEEHVFKPDSPIWDKRIPRGNLITAQNAHLWD